ncbi:MAG: adenylate kinase family protein [Thermoplasmata archaeon]|jgi:adenylate kinase
MRICITGTPGTGKSTISKLIPGKSIDLNEFARENGCLKGYDRKRRVRVVDIQCLKEKLRDLNDAILVGHYSHLLDCHIVIVFRTNPSILEKRLRERNYTQEKIRENMEAEALGIITQEALELCRNVYEIDTTSSDEGEILNIIEKIIEGKGEEYRAGNIDYTEEILKWY